MKKSPPESADEAVAAAPKPQAADPVNVEGLPEHPSDLTSNTGGNKVVRVVYPTDKFVIEDVPVITAEGTVLSSDQAQRVEQEAEKNGVRVVVEDEN